MGYLDTTVVDEESGIKVLTGNRGSTFVFNRKPTTDKNPRIAAADAADDASVYTSTEAVDEEQRNADLTKRPVIVCPAQFGGSKIYGALAASLRARGHPIYLVRLGPFDWLKVTKKLPISS